MSLPSQIRNYTFLSNNFIANNCAVFAFLLCTASSAAAIFGIIIQISMKRPADPWVAALIVDGWRSSVGLPVYEALGQGHATLMYGPAEPFALGLLYKITPLSNATPRFLVLTASLGLVMICILLVRRILPTLFLFPFALSLIAIENRVQYFSERRPDFLAWTLAIAGIIFVYRSIYGEKYYNYIGGIVLILSATLFKQNAAAVSLIPIFVVFYEDRSSNLFVRRILSAGPLAALSALLMALWIWQPVHFFYMVRLPRSYPIDLNLWLKTILLMLTGVPCVWFALGAVLSRDLKFDVEVKRRLAWLAVAAIIFLGASSLAAAKVGGSVNSLIPWWFSCILLFWFLTSPLTANSEGIARTPTWPAFILAGSAALFLTTPPALTWLKNVPSNISAIKVSNTAYDDVITQTRTLNGTIYSPEDPTITLYAKGMATRSIYAELDSTGWSQRIPDTVAAELRRADYIVDAKNWFQDMIRPADLIDMGFELTWSNDAYGIWHRTAGGEH